jgi:hypothetical protein
LKIEFMLISLETLLIDDHWRAHSIFHVEIRTKAHEKGKPRRV